MSGLYDQIAKEFSSLEQEFYSKSSLVAISHAIEDVVFEFEPQARMFVFFQKEKFFRQEKKRYQQLDNICQQLFLFADQFSEEVRAGFSNSHFVSLDDYNCLVSDKLLKDWAVIVDHPQYRMALITSELPDKQTIDRDLFRQFKGDLIFKEPIIESAITNLEEFIGQKNPNIGFKEPTSNRNTEQIFQPKAKQMLSLFLNNALNEIENSFSLLANQNVMLNHSLAKNEQKTREIIKRLCFAAEYKDEDTAKHLIRMGFTCTLLYSQVVNKESKLEEMFYGSLMHDIGKIGIPDKILLKPGSLTDREYETIKEHPEIAVNILRGSNHRLLETAQKIAYTHHEKWDGSGYPQGLAGEEIPLVGRIVAIADVFDALTADRVYKDAFSVEKAVNIMQEDRNSHFDGELLDIFLANLERIINFREEIEAEFSNLAEHEVAEHYFQLKPDFSQLNQAKIPSFKEVFSE